MLSIVSTLLDCRDTHVPSGEASFQCVIAAAAVAAATMHAARRYGDRSTEARARERSSSPLALTCKQASSPPLGWSFLGFDAHCWLHRGACMALLGEREKAFPLGRRSERERGGRGMHPSCPTNQRPIRSAAAAAAGLCAGGFQTVVNEMPKSC